MIVIGCCAGPSTTYDDVAGPGIARILSPDDLLIKETGNDGICAAYNRILDAARTRPDCEAVVLLHDDVLIRDDQFRQRVLDAVTLPGAGVIGIAGAARLTDGTWWGGRSRAGQVEDHLGHRVFGPLSADVDTVDGCLMILTPAAFRDLDFDSVGLPHFHGYDIDYCLRARQQGLRVLVRPFDVFHRSKGTFGNEQAFREAVAYVESQWADWILPLTWRDRGHQWLARARHTLATRLKGQR